MKLFIKPKIYFGKVGVISEESQGPFKKVAISINGEQVDSIYVFKPFLPILKKLSARNIHLLLTCTPDGKKKNIVYFPDNISLLARLGTALFYTMIVVGPLGAGIHLLWPLMFSGESIGVVDLFLGAGLLLLTYAKRYSLRISKFLVTNN